MDSLFNGTISNITRTHFKEWTIGPPVAQYPDLVAMGVMLIMTLVVALGAKCSSWFNSFFALLNVSILCFVIVVGFTYADISNWTSGFFPHGFSGVLSGAAVCFWAFSGFHILSCAVEEAHNPKRDIPIATVLALMTVMILYVGTTASLTIMTPYSEIDTSAPLPSAFAAKKLHWAQIIASLGPLCGLTTTLMSSMYSFVRISYKISEDGLLFSFLSRVNSYTRVPLWSILFCGTTMAAISLFFDLSELISFTVVLILMSYCLVCGGVIILRYLPQSDITPESALPSLGVQEGDNSTTGLVECTPTMDKTDAKCSHVLRHNMASSQQNCTARADASSDEDELLKMEHTDNDLDAVAECIHSEHVIDVSLAGHVRKAYRWMWPCNKLPQGRWPLLVVFILGMMTSIIAVIMVYHWSMLTQGTWWLVLLLTISMLIVVVTVATLYAYHQNIKGLTVKVSYFTPLRLQTEI